jgi:6,7-dimethyl-8-ribityllumazine synthase
MGNEFVGEIAGQDLRIAIVVGEFNKTITQKLLDSARKKLHESGVRTEDIDVAWVSGAFEIPQAVKVFCDSGKYDGVLPLGCVIRGETPHFDYICQSVSSGLTRLSLESSIPLVFGVLTVDSMEHALARSGIRSDKGAESAQALLSLISIIKQIQN